VLEQIHQDFADLRRSLEEYAAAHG
jgi:hypothetical protein